jgi:cystathionine beta-lyase
MCRLKEQMPAGMEMARWLAARPEVARVLHPGSAVNDPGHAHLEARLHRLLVALRDRAASRSSMKAVGAMLDDLSLFGMGASWGGYESLALPFDCTALPHGDDARSFMGPTIRLHIGLEDLEDLKEDLDAGFARLKAAS